MGEPAAIELPCPLEQLLWWMRVQGAGLAEGETFPIAANDSSRFFLSSTTARMCAAIAPRAEEST